MCYLLPAQLHVVQRVAIVQRDRVIGQPVDVPQIQSPRFLIESIEGQNDDLHLVPVLRSERSDLTHFDSDVFCKTERLAAFAYLESVANLDGTHVLPPSHSYTLGGSS